MMTGDEYEPPLDDELFSLLSRYDDRIVEGDSVGEYDPQVSKELRPRLRRAQLLINRLVRIGRCTSPDSADDSTTDRPTRLDHSPHANASVRDTQFQSAVTSSLASWQPSPCAPTRIGRFEIQDEIGSGGFGIVFHAFDPKLHREVALKIPRLGALATDTLRNRFMREVRAAAALDHPHIVPVFEAGEENSISYIVSAYCRGPDLAAWLRQRTELLPFRLAARLVSTLAEAVQHAHSRGVLHRDLKPSNILLEPLDEGHDHDLSTNDGIPTIRRPAGLAAAKVTEFPFIPKITDFGLAKIVTLDQAEAETKSTMLLGTLTYMSPEQAGGRSKQVGPQSDVYSLGVVLYELLIGRPPLFAESDFETLERVRREAPVPLCRLRPSLPRDLETICLVCLEKDPQQRYATAEALHEDLQRFLRGEPIHARPIPAPLRAWRWCKRHPLAATLMSLLTLLAIAGPLVATNQAWLYHEQARLYGEAESARKEARRMLYISDMNLALQAWEDGNVGRVQGLLDRHRTVAGQHDNRGFEWYYLWRQYQRSLTTTIQMELPVHCLGLSPNGKLLAVGGANHLVTLYDADSLHKVGELKGHTAQVISVAFSSDSTMMASASWDDTILLWDVISQRQLPKLDRERLTAWWVAFSPKGKTLAAANYDGSVTLWDLPSRQSRSSGIQHDGQVTCVAFSPNGRKLASCGLDGAVKVLDLDTDQVQTERHLDVWSLAFSPDGERLALACGRLLKIVDSNGGQLRILHGHGAAIDTVVFSSDGKRLASSGRDNVIALWDVATGEMVDILKGHFNSVQQVTYSVDGRQLFSGGLDGAVKAWDVTSNDAQDVLHHPEIVNGLSFSPAGDLLATACEDGKIRLWDVETGQFLYALGGHIEPALRVRFFAHEGQLLLASAGDDGRLIIWDVAARRALHDLTNFRVGRSLLTASNVCNTCLATSGWRAGSLEFRDGRPGCECSAGLRPRPGPVTRRPFARRRMH